MSGEYRLLLEAVEPPSSYPDMALGNPAEDLHSLLHSLRHTSPRLITSPPTQPRRASVALIIRMRPAPSLAFEGHVPEGWTGEVIPKSDWGLGLNLEDFFRLRESRIPAHSCQSRPLTHNCFPAIS
jgi:hypothetical protein